MIKVYGSSDDLIEVEGDLREEFSLPDSEPAYLGFSNGVLLQIRYDGIWSIRILSNPDGIATKVFEATDWESDDYSDVVEIGSHPEWVVCGEEMKRVRNG